MNAARTLATLAVAALLARASHAQVDLPDRPVAKPPAPPSVDLDRPGRKDREHPAQTGDLELPSEPVGSAAPAPAEPVPPSAAVPDASAPFPAPGTAAAFVLAELAKLRTPAHPLVDRAVESWAAMGEAGHAAAIHALADERAPLVLAGAKALLKNGAPGDAEAVQARLRRRLPSAACVPLVDVLCTLDPVHAPPAFLAELLAHPQAAVRTAAQRQLAPLGARLPVESLGAALAAKESDARMRAVTLLAQIPGERATRLLIERAADASPSVARRAVDALVAREGEDLDRELVSRALGSPWVLRTEAYLLLAVVEREDRQVRPILSQVHAEPLLRGLSSNDPFAAGCCAAALAGIGFRSSDVGATAWLDRDVTHRLVRVVAAADFSNDFSSLGPTAARRLALIAGESHGSDGPRWIEWWTSHVDGFVARRAALPATSEDSVRMRIDFASTGAEPRAYTLLGPELATGEAPLALDPLYLSAPQARDLFELFVREGIFSAVRLPGDRGDPYSAGRSITVEIGGRSKRFRFASASPEDWFERAADAVASACERNAWQRLTDPRVHASPRELWRAEAAWWDEPRSSAERERRTVELALARASGVEPSQRDVAVAELAAHASALGLGDFAALIEILRGEHFASARSRTLVDLALGCARLAPDAPESGLREEFSNRLVDALLAAFEASAPEELAAVLRASGRERVRAAARDERPFVRAVAAAELIRGAAPDAFDEEWELVRELLRDPVEDVEAAAVLALGDAKVEVARVELLVRARLGAPRVQAAALRSIGALGGDGVLDALLSALQKGGEVTTAAADGLARLRDPSTAPILISLLAEGAAHPGFEPARRGLADLGAAVRGELVRIARSPAHPARREAVLLLARDLAPEAAPDLIELAKADPRDLRVASELAVLSCVDHRAEEDPARAWDLWWQYVVKDDAQAWMCGALERLGVAAPAPEALRAGTPGSLEFLARVLGRDEPHLIERARRELARLAGRDPGAVPPLGRERDAWFAELSAAIERRGAAAR